MYEHGQHRQNYASRIGPRQPSPSSRRRVQPATDTDLPPPLAPCLPACLRYRTKKREEVSVLSGEVLVLHDYASTLKRLLERVQSGLYPIRQAAARFTIEIPKADKPPREVGVRGGRLDGL